MYTCFCIMNAWPASKIVIYNVIHKQLKQPVLINKYSELPY